MRKAVFFDVDSTLLSYSTNPAHVPEPTRRALEHLLARGHAVALATGRSLMTAGRLMRELGIDNAVLCGGAHIVLNWETAETSRIPQDAAEAIARVAADGGCNVYACTHRHMYTNDESEEMRRYLREQSIFDDVLRPLREMRDVCLFNVYGETLPPPEAFTGADVTVEPYGIEIRPAGISKASGIRTVAGRLGIPMEDTVAFGDGNNDVEMLRAAGTGIAVGNGGEAARRAADIVTEPIDDGGILHALTRLGLI